MRRIQRLVVFAIVLAFAAWCVFSLRGDLSQLSLAPVMQSWDVVVFAALLSLLNYVLRSIRWRSYLARLGHTLPRRFCALVYIAGFAYTLSPGKFGEIVRARYCAPLGVPLSDVAAAFFAERLVDLIVMIVFAALVFTASSHYSGAIVGAAAIVVVVLASFALIPWAAADRIVKSRPRIPHTLRSLLAGLTSTLVSTRPLLRPSILAGAFVVGLCAWGLEGVGFGLLSSIYPSVHLTLVDAIGIYGLAVLVGGLSFLPGGLGSTEAVMMALLVTRGYSVSQALVVTLVCRLVTLWLAVCLGWVTVLVLRQRAVAAVTP